MIKVRIIKATSEINLEEEINSFLLMYGIEDFDSLRIHYTFNEYEDKSGNNKQHHAALIEYKV